MRDYKIMKEDTSDKMLRTTLVLCRVKTKKKRTTKH